MQEVGKDNEKTTLVENIDQHTQPKIPYFTGDKKIDQF